METVVKIENKSGKIKKIVLSGLMLAIALMLPFLTGQIPQIGSALCPMHFPVLICGFLCGWPYGLAVGVIAPLLRFVLFGMPPIFPTGLAMAVELAAYGAVSGLLYKKLPKTTGYLYVVLIISMLVGRVAWGAVSMALYNVSGKLFTLTIFLSGAFLKAIPGIICQIILVPLIVLALKRAGFTANE